MRTLDSGVIRVLLLTIFFLLPAAMVDAGAVSRIFPNDSPSNRFALRAGLNANYVKVSASSGLAAGNKILSTDYFYQVDRLGGEKIALKSLGNNKFVTAEDGGASPLIANRDAASTWETFTVVDLGGYNIALKSDANSKYVTAVSFGGGLILIATKTSVGSAETFRLLPVIDMAEVVSAFPKRYAGYSKYKTFRQNTGCSQYDNKKVYERWVDGKMPSEIVNISVSWDDARILDWLWLAADRIGGHGTFPMCQESTYFNPAQPCPVALWNEMIPLAHRYITPDMGIDAGTEKEIIEGSFTTSTGKSNSSALSCGTCAKSTMGNEVHRFGYEPMGGNLGVGTIGPRWYVKIATDLTRVPTYTKEYFTWDLGPNVNVYKPEFGWIMYEQTNKPACQGYSSGGSTIEKYGDLVNENTPSGGFFNYFSYH
jgi:hypothetical protein